MLDIIVSGLLIFRHSLVVGIMSAAYTHSDETWKNFYDLLGRVVIAWSRIERSLDIAILETRTWGQAKHREGAAIVSLRLKIRILRGICEHHPALSKESRYLGSLLDQVSEFARARDTLVHGYCHGTSDDADPTLHFRATRYEPQGTKSRELKLTRGQLVDFLRQLHVLDYRLGLAMIFLAQRLRHATCETSELRLSK